MKKIFKKLHLWLSIPLGILITIICLTGAILVFRAEIEEAANKHLIITKETGEKKLSIAELIPIVDAQLENDTVTGVTIPSDTKQNYSVSVSSNRRATVFINPYTGEVLGKMEDSFFSKIMQLHRWLLIKRDIGKPIVGYTTLIMVVIMISGLIIIIPKTRKQLKRIFTIKVTKGWKRFWYDLHISGGNIVFIGLLVLALTGLTWSFQWYRVPFYKLFGAEVAQHNHAPQQAPQQISNSEQPHRGEGERQNRKGSQENLIASQEKKNGERQQQGNGEMQRGKKPERNATDKPKKGSSEQQPALGQNPSGNQGGNQQRRKETLNITHWDNLLAHIQSQNPNYKRISIRNNSATVTQNKTWGNSRATDRYSFNGETGEITEYLPYKDQERSTKVRGWIYSVHVGSWGGWFSKIITFIIALVGASLPVTGYYLWIKRLNAKKKNKTKIIVEVSE